MKGFLGLRNCEEFSVGKFLSPRISRLSRRISLYTFSQNRIQEPEKR